VGRPDGFRASLLQPFANRLFDIIMAWMALPYTHLVDELATAYIQAVAATAGCTIAIQRKDYGIDGTLRYVTPSDDGFHETGFPVDFQLKGTSIDEADGDEVVFDLKVANYNKIVARSPKSAPYYLLLICFPHGPVEWCRVSDEELVLAARAYWWTEVGARALLRSTKRIRIPNTQRLSNDAIVRMFATAEARYQP
jgi:Domain of unknown function (DUF4365)